MTDKTFVFHTIWRDSFKRLDMDLQLKVLNAILDYAESGAKPDDPVVFSLCAQIFQRLDLETEHYEQLREKKRNAAKRRWEKNTEKIQENNSDVTSDLNGDAKDADACVASDCIDMQYNNNNSNINTNNNTNSNNNSLYNINIIERELFARSREKFLKEWCKSESIPIKRFKKLARDVLVEWEVAGARHNSIEDALRHLMTVVRIKANSSLTNKNISQNGNDIRGIGNGNPQLSDRRFLGRAGTGLRPDSDYDSSF